MDDTRTMSIDDVTARLDAIAAASDDVLREKAASYADELLALGETILESWVLAHDKTPTAETVEGFRLLALHRQGARGEPSFNACRETCREAGLPSQSRPPRSRASRHSPPPAAWCYGGAALGAVHRRQVGSRRPWRLLLLVAAAAPERGDAGPNRLT